MTLKRYAARRDTNEREIVATLRGGSPMSKTVLHDLRVEATIACDERGASVPASRLRCSCGFYTEAVMEADAYVLNLMAQHHLEAVSRLHHWRRNHGRG